MLTNHFQPYGDYGVLPYNVATWVGTSKLSAQGSHLIVRVGPVKSVVSGIYK